MIHKYVLKISLNIIQEYNSKIYFKDIIFFWLNFKDII